MERTTNTRSETVPPELPRPPPSVAPPSPDDSTHLRILVVEDSRMDARILSLHLQTSGFSVITADSGEKALDLLDTLQPDLVILDIGLPGINGIDVCRRIRAMPGMQDVPVIFVTGAGDQVAAVFAAGAADFIHKPIDPAQLQCRVDSHLRERELRIALRRSVSASESLSRLGSMVSEFAHEVNSPLSACVLAASSMREFQDEFRKKFETNDISRSDMQTFLQRMHDAGAVVENNAALASELIANFKEVAIDESSGRTRRIALGDYLRKLIAHIGPEFDAAGVETTVEVPDSLTLETQPGLLSQIVRNLVFNSLRHGFPGREHPRIRIAASSVSDGWTLSYADNGNGMSDEVRERLFEKYFTTRPNDGGSGVGMHVVGTLVQRLGGMVEVETAPGQGVEFRFRFPQLAPDSD